MPLRLALSLFALLALAACRMGAVRSAPTTEPPPEERVRLIPLDGPLASPDAELSGLAWRGDRLVLLPQYPGRFAAGADTVDLSGTMKDEGSLFTLAVSDLLAFVDGTGAEVLHPEPIPFAAPGVAATVPGFEGYEAIVFRGDQVFVLAESSGAGSTRGYLIAGTVASDGSIRLDAETMVPLPPQTSLDNLSYETLLAMPDGVIALQEANGAVVNPSPQAYRFDAAAQPRGSLRVPTLEYRLTDATEVDADGRFWVMNFFYPGDRALLRPAPDSLGAAFGQGPTHRQGAMVERLVEFHLDGERIERTGRAPIQLELYDVARNWEGLVRLGERGFIVATDTYPATLLAFVPVPSGAVPEAAPLSGE